MISVKEYQAICKKFNLVPYEEYNWKDNSTLFKFPESNNFGSNTVVTCLCSYGARVCKYYDSAHKWLWLPCRLYPEELEKDLIVLCEIVKQMTIKKKKEEIYKDFK